MKAVIPAAGYGTRFLPVTRAQPKEMLPIIDKPVIQFVVEEAVASGIDDILIITGRGKRSIEDHFDKSVELNQALEKRCQKELLKETELLDSLVTIHYVRQKEQLGLGHAILQAKRHVDNEAFAVLLGDTIIKSSGIPATKQLMDAFGKVQASVLGIEEVPKEKVSRYGIMDVAGKAPLFELRGIIEKPSLAEAPSCFASNGRYVFTPALFDFLEKTKPGKNNEIQYADAVRMLLGKEKAYGLLMDAKRYDIGNKLDYLKTVIDFALEREEFSSEISAYLKRQLK